MKMQSTVGSLFSGIGGFDLGLERAGWEVRWQVENDSFCNKILRRHWPDVTRYGDITAVEPSGLERVDLICGGFPCQDVSVAGKRTGLAGERSSLFWEFVRIARALRPRWVLVENVPGLFSSNDGRDFRAVLGGLEQLGYGLCWRVLDSRYFGVPQRRRRVFIVGCLGAYCPPAVLFEPESGERHPPEGGEARSDLAPRLRARADSSSRDGQDIAHALHRDAGVSHPLLAKGNSSHDDSLETYIAGAVTGAEAHNGNSRPIPDNYVVNARQDPIVSIEESLPLDAQRPVHAIAATLPADRRLRSDGNADNRIPGAETDPNGVREATGLPRGLDSARYRSLGNAVTVPVAEWIGERILEAHKHV